MTNKNIILSLLFFSFYFTSYSQKKNNLSCSSFLMRYGEYWKNDSLGNHGFRLLATQTIKKSCTLEGEMWDTYKYFFGKANEVTVNKGDTFYRFKLTNYPRIDAMSNRYLDIIVDGKGKIKMFKDWTPS